MEFGEYARQEAAGFADRLATAAEQVRSEVEARAGEQLAAARATVAALQSARDEANARIRQLEAELSDAGAQLETARRAFEADRTALATEGAKLSADLDGARAQESALRQHIDKLLSDQTTRAREFETLSTTAAALREENEALLAEDAELRQEFEALRAGDIARRQEADALRAAHEALRQDHEALCAADAALRQENEALRDQATALAEDRGTLRGEIETLRRAEEVASSVLTASLRATEALGAAADVNALFAALVKALAGELPRAALFRVKGNHLECEQVAGPGDAATMKKLVIPMSVDSIITRAVARDGIVTGEGDALAETRSPFGGMPTSALAASLSLGDEPLAVVYAESDGPSRPAHASFAELLARHTEVLLSKLSRELKTMKELRDYAAMLLQEAEQMYLADVQGESREEDCIRRLQDAIECGRQLYAQRAELEGSMATGLFDDQIAAAIRTPASRFAAALEAAVTQPSAQRTAS